jgi:hypothetical protein
VCILLVALFVIPLWYIIPIAIDESIKFYMSSQEWDFVTPLKTIFPSLFQSEDFAQEIGRSNSDIYFKSCKFSYELFIKCNLKFCNTYIKVISNFVYFLFCLERSRRNSRLY